MRKAFKNLLASLLALAMVCALAAPVFAATEDLTTHSFEAYQIFKGTYDETTGKLSDINWGDNIDGATFLPALQADRNIGGAFENATDAASVAKAMEKWGQADNMTIAFAKFVAKHTKGDPTSSSNSSIALPAAGYYLIVDTTDIGDYNNANISLLRVIDNTLTYTVNSKVEKPSFTQKIQQKNGTWSDSYADYAIGDSFDVKLTAKLPESTSHAYDYYDAYKVVFSETLSDCFTYGNITNVQVGGIGLSADDFTVTPTTASAGYKSFEVTIPDVKTVSRVLNVNTMGATIEVTYTVTLGKNANITYSDGDGTTTNTISGILHYSANPNNSSSMGVTPQQKAHVFTYGVKNTKYADSEDGNKLGGAEFQLLDSTGKPMKFKQDSNKNYYPSTETDATDKLVSSEDATNKGEFNIIGLAPGTYTLTETKAPGGYNTCEPISINTTPTSHTSTGVAPFTTISVAFNTDANMVNNIVDHSGVVLPSTGGMGTTIFYVVGGLLMVGAAVLLVTKKRMENN